MTINEGRVNIYTAAFSAPLKRGFDNWEWGTPIVPVLKNDGTITICGDYKITVNPALEKTVIYPLPRVEYLFAVLKRGQYFSKIDLKQAYQQILVTPKIENTSYFYKQRYFCLH